LPELLKERLNHNFYVSSEIPETGDVFIIAVPTPLEEHGHYADLSMVEAATRSILPHLRAEDAAAMRFDALLADLDADGLDELYGLKTGDFKRLYST
jgi:hypothetical protein